MIYKDKFFEKLSTALHQEAEMISNNVGPDGLNNEILTVEVEGEYFEFPVEVSVEDYDYEEGTNSVSYKAKVFCKGIPEHENEKLVEYMKIEFLNEYIYI